MTPWSTIVEVLHGDHVRVSVMLSTDPGPMREFRRFLDVDLDEAHAAELLAHLALAMRQICERRDPAKIIAFPGADR